MLIFAPLGVISDALSVHKVTSLILLSKSIARQEPSESCYYKRKLADFLSGSFLSQRL